MILNVYNTRDERAREFGTPIFSHFDSQQMVEVYQNTVKDALVKLERMAEINPAQAAQLAMNASQLRDSVIYQVGTFDSLTGKIEFMEEPNLVVRVGDLFPKDFNLGVVQDA